MLVTGNPMIAIVLSKRAVDEQADTAPRLRCEVKAQAVGIERSEIRPHRDQTGSYSSRNRSRLIA